jgi:hypothetical protein
LFEHVSYLIYFRLIRLSFFIFMMNNWDIWCGMWSSLLMEYSLLLTVITNKNNNKIIKMSKLLRNIRTSNIRVWNINMYVYNGMDKQWHYGQYVARKGVYSSSSIGWVLTRIHYIHMKWVNSMETFLKWPLFSICNEFVISWHELVFNWVLSFSLPPGIFLSS